MPSQGIAMSAAYVIVGTIGVVGNMLVVIVFIKYKKLFKKHKNDIPCQSKRHRWNCPFSTHRDFSRQTRSGQLRRPCFNDHSILQTAD